MESEGRLKLHGRIDPNKPAKIVEENLSRIFRELGFPYIIVNALQ